MKIRYEVKSNRVKGLCFHPNLPWVIATLHNGSINLYDYVAKRLIHHFEEHVGPVRGIDIHKTQPLFVSGGDDFKVKVWNLNERRSLYTFNNHTDYIRMVQFHWELPWILSCSDDQTIRIFNWQNRSCIALLTGHSHYVMSAFFHPEEDLIISSSLDETVRIWDYSELKKKYSSSRGSATRPSELGAADVTVKIIMDGHDKPVNWAAFHPKKRVVVSGADDKTVKIWRYQDTRAWEIETLRGHGHNVVSCLFHPKYDLVISVSEDKSLRVWDYNNRVMIDFYKRDMDRFWIVATHPTLNYLAAGHDGGFIIFKLESERPPLIRLTTNTVAMVTRHELAVHDLTTGKATALCQIPSPPDRAMLNNYPKFIHVNPFDTSSKAFILSYRDSTTEEPNRFQVCVFPVSPSGIPTSGTTKEPRYFESGQAVFVAKDKLCVWKGKELFLCDYGGAGKKPVVWSEEGDILSIFPGPMGKMAVSTSKGVGLYDFASKKMTAKLKPKSTSVKNVVWSKNFNKVAIVLRTFIIVADKNFNVLFQTKISEPVLSGCFNENDSFIYTTHHHVKYIINEDSFGIIATIHQPIYLICIAGTTLYYVDRQGVVGTMKVDMSEYTYKLNVKRGRVGELTKQLSKGEVVGSLSIRYLEQQGLPELALAYEKDEKSKFKLAIASGNLEAALVAAMEMKRKDYFAMLAEEAVKQGNVQIAEMCYQKMLAFDKLVFLYVLTGNFGKLEKIMNLAKAKLKDPMLEYQTALLVGNIEAQVKLLAEAGHLALAYVLAKKHGLEALTAPLAEAIKDNSRINQEILDDSAKVFTDEKLKRAVFGLRPVARDFIAGTKWPVEEIKVGRAAAEAEAELIGEITEERAAGRERGPSIEDLISEDILPSEELKEIPKAEPVRIDAAKGAWGEEAIIEAEEPEQPLEEVKETEAGLFVAPTQGTELALTKIKSSLVSGLHCAVGEYETALRLLQKQIALMDPAPLKPVMERVHLYSNPRFALLGNASTSNVQLVDSMGRPVVPLKMGLIKTIHKKGMNYTTEGNFAEALKQFRKCIQIIPLTYAATADQEEETRNLVKSCAEYISAMRCQVERQKQPAGNKQRIAELCCYMCTCKVDDGHRFLALKNAVGVTYKMGNYITAAHLCKRILDYQGTGVITPEIVAQYQKNYNTLQAKGTNELKLDFDSSKIGQLEEAEGYLCESTLTPLKNPADCVKCPYDKSTHEKEMAGKICPVCEMCKIGEETIGLVLRE